jgi:DNA-binding response OmpR family regulator
MRVLLVEDSEKLQTYIGKALKYAGYAVDVTGDGEDGLHLAENIDYDVLILDLMLPKLDGLSIIRKLRNSGNPLHILVLTAKDTLADRVNGLQQGADDYLVKPFAMAELIARVQVLARRSHHTKNPVIQVGDLVIDTAGRTVSRSGTGIDLRPREYSLPEYLALNRDRVVSRSEIEEQLYNDQVDIMSNAVNSAICSIRKRIDIPGEKPVIETRRGMGPYVAG